MFALILAAAAGYTAPVPAVRDRWIDPLFDFPKRGVKADEVTYIMAELIVNPRGYVTGCRARAAYGNPAMAAYTCELLKMRAQFRPARDPTGRRMYGVYRQHVGWWMGDKQRQPPAPLPRLSTFEISLDALPSGTEQPPIAGIQFYVDTNGNGSSCEPMDNVPNEALAEIACQQLAGSLRVAPANDRRGRPVPSVQTASVKAVTSETLNVQPELDPTPIAP